MFALALTLCLMLALPLAASADSSAGAAAAANSGAWAGSGLSSSESSSFNKSTQISNNRTEIGNLSASVIQVYEPQKIPNKDIHYLMDNLIVPSIFPISPPQTPGPFGPFMGDYMPVFAAVKAYDKNNKEEVVAIESFNGWVLDRIRLEDVQKEVLKHLPEVVSKWGEKEKTNIRFWVFYKSSVFGAGTSGGINGVASALQGASGVGGGAAILPGVNRSTVDPSFVVYYYLVKGSKEETKS